MSGVLLIVGGIALIELWRRGYLAGLVDSAKAAAAGKPGPASLYVVPTRPFTLPGSQPSLGGAY